MAESFWSSIKVWSEKPHVVNKRLAGVAVVTSWRCPSSFLSWEEIVQKHLDLVGLEEQEIIKAINEMMWTTNAEPWFSEKYDQETSWASLRKCLPKQCHRHQPLFELEIIDMKLKCAVYIPLNKVLKSEKNHLIPPAPYAVILSAQGVDLQVYNGNDYDNEWLTHHLLPKLNKWFSETGESTSSVASLRLVSLEDYNALYQNLKEKYVKNIASIWPECTDPQKFIHEDVAIAAYLILLWRKERTDLGLGEDYRQTFIDIGCGNGLLVYLLASEGYRGKGIDIRSRKIWSFYPPEVQLEVFTLIPSEETFFTEYDWLLGNHSDELTPWIPVIALQSSIKRQPLSLPTRYWVLPCCPFSFWGKFQREKFNASNSSRYCEYLRYIADVGRRCGFEVEEDRMRIPSTRRICFVGTSLPKKDSEWMALLKEKSILVQSDMNVAQGTTFQPRPAVEMVRNCTRVERSVQEEIVNLTAKYLLDNGTKEEGDHNKWNWGGKINITDLIDLLKKEFNNFNLLKSECGGVQTLLRNHSHIFVVQNKCVRFRSPEELSSSEWRNQKTTHAAPKKMRRNPEVSKNVKKKSCWFFANHPDGCPLNEVDCRYHHVNNA